LIVQKRSLKNVSTAKTLFLPDSCERNQIASASALQQKCATLKVRTLKTVGYTLRSSWCAPPSRLPKGINNRAAKL